MPVSRAGGGPGPLLMNSGATGKSAGGGPNRGANDTASFASPTTGAAALHMDASLASPELIRQLLSVARGDLSAVVTAAATDTTGTNTHDGGGHSPAGPTGRATTVSLIEGNSGGNESTTGTGRTSMAKAGAMAVTVETGGPVGVVPRPVAVLRSSPSAASPPRTRSSGDVARAASTVKASATAAAAAACVTTDAEACAFYLTALVAHAMHREDYWVDLRHQIEVDHHVEFLQFCAEAGFGTLKTMHLLQWWRQYRALVRSATSTHPLFLSDGNPQAPPFGAGGSAAAYTTPTTVAGGDAAGGTAASPAAAAGSAAKASSKKGRRGSATGGSTAADADAAPLPSAFPPFATPGPDYTSHEEAVRGELQRFVQWELEHEYEWRLVPREPFSGGGLGPRSPVGVGGAVMPAAGGATAGTAAQPSAAAPAGKSSKADKAKMQLQQQQELEWEEQRLARIAALPPENIFLTAAEAAAFVRHAVTEDLATHAALHVHVATAEGRPTHTLAHAAAAPVFFSVQVEMPMPVPPLREAVRPSAQVAAATPPVTPRLSNDAAATAGHAGQRSPTKAPTRPASSAQSKPRSRGNSKGPAGANANAAAAAAPPTSATPDTADEQPAAVPLRKEVLLNPMEALRAEQAKEAAAYRAAYAEELVSAEALERQRQHTADVTLFFEKASTQTAVQAVYASMEDAVAARQQRILQRVAALEQALGVAGGEGAAGEAGAGE